MKKEEMKEKAKEARTKLENRLNRMRGDLDKNLQGVLAQTKKLQEQIDQRMNIELDIKKFRTQLQSIDKEKARKKLEDLGALGRFEAKRLAGQVHAQLTRLNDDLKGSSAKLQSEVEKVRGRVKDTLTSVKSQIKEQVSAARKK